MGRRFPFLFLLAAMLAPPSGAAAAESWIFRASRFSHDPWNGERVNQFQAERQSYLREDPTYLESGYRHIHAGLRGADGSYDHTHVVQTWGEGERIRPYGEWEYPFRAGATPFGPWGNPQGPWTLPFDSWYNPYGLGKLPYGPGPYSGPYGGGPYGGGPYGASPYGASPYGGGPSGPSGGPYPGPYGGGYPTPPTPHPGPYSGPHTGPSPLPKPGPHP